MCRASTITKVLCRYLGMKWLTQLQEYPALDDSTATIEAFSFDRLLASVLPALARERVLRQDNGSRPAGRGPMVPGAATEALSLKPLLGFGVRR
jgi:hypothetical protein